VLLGKVGERRRVAFDRLRLVDDFANRSGERLRVTAVDGDPELSATNKMPQEPFFVSDDGCADCRRLK
jgi:hypothetical protein